MAVQLSFNTYAENPIAAVETSLDANAFLGSIDATITAANFTDVDAKATLYIGSVSSTTAVAAFADVDAKATTNLGNTPAATAISNFTDVDAQATHAIASVSAAATHNALGDYTLTANPVVSGAYAQGVNPVGLNYDAKANLTLDAATADADLTVNDFADEDAQGTATVSGVSAATATNWDTSNGIYAIQVIFVNTDFERARTVNIVPYGNYKVYVTR